VEINVVPTYGSGARKMDIVVGIGGEDDRKKAAN
jgi:hypothetical protein